MAAFLLTPCSPGVVSYWHGAVWSKTAAGWAPDRINTCVPLPSKLRHLLPQPLLGSQFPALQSVPCPEWCSPGLG